MRVKLLRMTETPIDVMWVAARTCYSEKSPIEMWEERYPEILHEVENYNEKTWKVREEKQEKMWNLVSKVLDSGHSCYDENTEVLTSNGFKFWKDINEDDLIASIEPITNKMHFEKPMRLVHSDYSGRMYLFDNKYINLCVTPNHRLYSSLIQRVEDRKEENFDFYKCEDVVYKNNKSTNVEVALRPQKFKTYCETSSNTWYNPLNLPEDKLVAFNNLIGFFIGDGYAEGGNRLEFHLKKERKINYLKSIISILGWDLNEYTNNKYKVFLKDIGNYARNNYYDKEGNKQIPLELICTSKECICAFIDGLMNSDGSHYNKNSFSYLTTSTQVASTLQGLVHIVGGHASIKAINLSNTNGNWKNTYRMEICIPNNHSSILVNDSRHKQKDVSIISYNGKVYCCEVSTGLLMVRRNNKICLCGNSIAEHVSFTFAIEGIDRATSHQLVRHRAGIVFSQQSQRYVEIKESYETLTEAFDGVTTEQEDYLKTVAERYFTNVNSDNYRAYVQALINYLGAVKRGVKPEDARMILPNATKTNLVMTVNLRELMHVSNLRLCSRAQLPIRQLFKAAKEEVAKVEPRLAALLVPSCESNKGICFEGKSCGRYPTINEVKGEKHGDN